MEAPASQDRSIENMSANAKGISTIQELAQQGRSPWLDNLHRDMISSGELADCVTRVSRGSRANPKAVA
jgi:hypothetical protein